MSGYGYGDRDFSHACQRCGAVMNHEFLLVAKFKEAVENVVLKDWPLGGTILAPQSGAPDLASVDEQNITLNTFPNRLFRLALRSSVLELVKTEAPTMNDVKLLIERAVADKALIKGVNGKSVFESGVPQRFERLSTRKMMSQYKKNPSIFALELGGAVVRQGVFVDKMYSIDWIHSPAARETMDRLLGKYARFMKLMAAYHLRIAVPTLDVDLGWHTHQLSPKAYFEYTMAKAKRFLDHDDKIDEDSLSKHFQWTSKTYEAEYGELYSECICWYCEGEFFFPFSMTSLTAHSRSSADPCREGFRNVEAGKGSEPVPRIRSSKAMSSRKIGSYLGPFIGNDGGQSPARNHPPDFSQTS